MSAETEYSYVGSELELFIKATRWKNYWASRVRPFVRGNVLDVGAGLGATFDYLGESAERWTCLEPDPALCEQLSARLATHPKPPRVQCGTLDTIASGERFDSIVYIDVLEHIEHDRAEVERAVQHLASGGLLIVLLLVLPFLFSPFDQRVGSFRPYPFAPLKGVPSGAWSLGDGFYWGGSGVLA